MKRSPLLRYSIAVVAVGVILLAKLLLNPLITEQSPFLLLSAAVMVGAWFGGLGPGLLATALAALVADYFFLPPVGSFTGLDAAFLPLALFAVQGLVISSLTQALHSARQRAEVSALEAEGHQESLRRSEERFRALVQNSSDVITVIDAGGTIRYVSPAVERVMGYRPEELVGKGIFDYVHPDVLAEAQKVFAEAWSRPGIYPAFEFEVPHKDGTWRRAEFLLNNLLDDPSVRGVVVNQRDVTERKETEQKLRESEELYRRVVEQAAESIFLVDGETKRVIQANAAFHDSLGYTPEETTERTLYDIVAHDREDIDRNLQQILEEGHRFIGERQYRRKDGSLINVEVNAGVLPYGGMRALCIVAHDVTERKVAEVALRRTLDQLLALFEAGRVLGSSLERGEIASKLLAISKRLSGLDAAAIHLHDRRGKLSERQSLGMETIPTSVRDLPEVRSAVREASEEGSLGLLQLGSLSLEKQRVATAVFLPLRVRDRVVGVLEAYGPDALAEKESAEALASLANQAASALENARLYEELAERERELHDLVGQIVVSQEEERRRVAYDVHDGLTQIAVAAYQRLEMYKEDYPCDSARGLEEMDEIIDLVRRTVAEARRVIADLRPTMLDDLGLVAAIQGQVTELRAAGYEADYNETLGGERLPTAHETALFRVAQEALTNVRKHAQTDRVRVTLGRKGQLVRLEVRDWGRGFEPSKVARGDGPGERVGLSSMRERIALLGGDLEIRSEPGEGTSVVARIPLR